MKEQLDVLIVESQRGAAQKAEVSLVAAGHRVHRCHDADDRGFPCVGVSRPDGCPLDQTIDVALLVRPHVEPRPTPLEDGVSCVIRAGVPLVEDGPDLLDPYDPWVSGRVPAGGDVVEAVASAAERSLDPLREGILERCARLFQNAGIRPDDVVCHIRPQGTSLWVWLEIAAAVDTRLEQAMAVRVLDAVRGSGRTYGEVDVQVTGNGR